MQLRFKKFCLFSTIFVYFASFLLQSNLGLIQTLAQGTPEPTNIVAILVDSKLLGGKFDEKLKWYATKYIQEKKIFNSNALVIPLDTSSITAYDIYRMLENIYFDGFKDEPSSLVGLIMFGDIPLPVVNQNGYIFPTVYPYVDFVDQKYVWDSDVEYFVSNNNPGGQAEIWHGLINYGDDIDAYTNDDKTGFFDKVREYDNNPESFIGKSIWYDDFISQKKTFLDNNFPYYRNRIMFAEDLGYQRYSPLMKNMFERGQIDSMNTLFSDFSTVFGSFDEFQQQFSEMSNSLDNTSYTTKMIQQEIDTSFVSDYNDLFSVQGSSIARENIFAGSRWIKEYTNSKGEKSLIVDSDSSTSKIQLKDDLLLGNENLQGLIENLNDLMEKMIDDKIEEKNLSMDIVIPVSYKNEKKKRIDRKCRSLVDRYENYYFGNNARLIDSAEDLSIYRGTYRNLSSISGFSYDSLLSGKNQIKSVYDKTNLRLKSIGGSYDIFSMQVEGNRGFNMFNVDSDLDVYEENKTQKDAEVKHRGLGRLRVRSWPESCNDNDEDEMCETLFDFAKRWWGGASPINLDKDSVGKGRYVLSGYKASDSWRPIFGMDGFQSLLSGDDEGFYGQGWKDGKGNGPQRDATNFRSYIKYASPTQREGWRTRRWIIFRGYETYQNHTPDVHMDFKNMNYRDLSDEIVGGSTSLRILPFGFGTKISSWTFSKLTNKLFSISNKLGGCGGGGIEEYVYKVISSIVKHTSTTDDQINGIDRDKYGENGTLGKYYHDVRVEYEDLLNMMSGSLDAFSGLIVSVNSGNDYLNEKFGSLKTLLLNINKTYVPDPSLNDKLLELEDQLSGLQAQLSGLELELVLAIQSEEGNENLESSDENLSLGGFEGEEYVEQGLESGMESENIVEIEMKIEELKQAISELEHQIESVKSQIRAGGASFQSTLDEVSEYLKLEKEQLIHAYELVMSLYTDDILSTLEFIAYVEGGNPEDYMGTNSSNLVKVGFLPSWIENINNIILEVRTGENKLLSGYEEVYSLIQGQQEDWFELADELKNINENYSDVIDKVTEDMQQIFTIIDDGKEYDENGNVIVDEIDENFDGESDTEELSGDIIILTGGTVREVMDDFESDISELSNFFSNLIKRDEIGPAIIQAAKSDKDFRSWLVGNSVKLSDLNEVDWINQYAQWASGPGYDKEGPRKNHELLQGASIHMSGINLLTPDRPIDSPRYVSMQSVAGNEMKFIYPDLFKVEVYELSGKNRSGYDIHLLLTGGQIKKNLVRYLTGKVDEYNKIIQQECNNALTMNAHFSGLRNMSYFGATPEKIYHSCGTQPFTYEDFVDALGGEKMLDTISEVLYYQSLTNKRKLGAGNVDEDIQFIKESFNLNGKRKQILKDYLVEGNEKTKNLMFEIPTYELSGYEVGYINSDGRDYIFPADEIDENTSVYNFGISTSMVKNQSDLTNANRRQLSDDENKFNDECDIPVNGRLLLFDGSGSPWLKGFTCWLKQVQKKPVKLKLTFQDSLGEVLAGNLKFKDYLKGLGKDLEEPFVDWKDSWSSYKDEWEEILSKDETRDYDARITQMQVEAEKHNQEEGVTDDIIIDTSSLILSEINPISELKITSLSDLGNITVSFEGTGDGCIKVNSTNLCDSKSVRKTFNPKKNPITFEISSSDNVAGKVGLIVTIQVAGKTMEKIIKYTVSPGTPVKVSFKISGNESKNKNVVIGGMMVPINVTLYDKDDNVVSRGVDKYKFSATTGRFLKNGGYMKNFSTNDFRDLNFYYEVPQKYEGEIDIQFSTSEDEIVGTLPLHVISATLETKVDNTLIEEKDDVCYRLGYQNPSCNPCASNACPCGISSCKPTCTGKIILSKNVFEEIYEGGKLDISKLHKVDVSLKDVKGNLIDINNEAIVTSKNGLLVLGQVKKNEDGDNIFFETSKFYMTGGHVEVYYYFSTVAGNDALNIDVPGIISRSIAFVVQEHTCSNYSAKLRNGYVEVGVPDYLELFSADIFGNAIDIGFSDCYDQTKIDFPKSDTKSQPLCGWNDEAKDYYYEVSDGNNKIEIVGVGAGTTEVAGLEFEVAEPLIPDSGLNIMYLNYFGNDRGNQWGYRSNNNKRVEYMMKNSRKLIATTTQLVSEDKIKKLLWRVDPGLIIVNFDNFDTTLSFDNGSLILKPSGELSNGINIAVGFNDDSVQNINSLRDINSWLSNQKMKTINYVFYVPSEPEYQLSKKMDLYGYGEKVGSLYGDDMVLKLSNQTLDNGDNVWDLVYNGVSYGSIVLHCPNARLGVSEGIFNSRYSIGPVFTKGSTNNMSSIGIFDEFSNFELDTNYKSIQNSDEIDEKVGFIGDFKNITLFAEGQSVGEATKKFGSELLINLGDPVLSLEKKMLNDNAYGMDYDGGIGREIYEDGEGGIFGTYMINDKDLLVAYSDGRFKLAKNYGGSSKNYDMKNLQELMRLAVPIRDIFVGDVNGGGDDIIVYTQNNQMRAYLNKGGAFDVDGTLICLNQNVYGGERSSTPSDLEGINQFFIEDMDGDNIDDIITSDAKGYIKVFYGPWYLSKDQYSCDRGRYDRQVNNTTVVTAFGLKVGGEVIDDSMVHRNGIGSETTGQIFNIENPSEFGINIDVDSLSGFIKYKDRDSDGSIEDVTKLIMDSNNFNLSKASEEFVKQESRYVDVTLYENTLLGGTGKNYLFVPMGYLKEVDSPCSVSKKYSRKVGSGVLVDGDLVTVSVSVSCGSETGAFGDVIKGPRNIYYNSEGIIKSFRFVGNNGDAIVKKRDGNFAYLVDNIRGTVSFEYDLEYHHVPLRKMSITHETYWSDDEYPDIKLQSVDGCIKDFSGYVNQGSVRKFIGKNIPLQDMINEEYFNEENRTQDFAEDIFGVGSDVNKIPGIIGNSISRIKLLQSTQQDSVDGSDTKESIKQKMKDYFLNSSDMNFIIDVSIFEEEMEKIDDIIDDLMKGMCNGFSFGGANNCKGLPVPFNQAFLAPGKYHLFGCWELPMGPLENGLPVFFFPGTLPIGPVNIPIPWGLKSPADGFLRPGGGVYPSFIRIYAAPTLTAQLGIAICMSPDRIWRNVPSPLSDIAGNCVVFAVKPQCKNDDKYSEIKKDENNPNEVYAEFTQDVKDSGICTSSKKTFPKGYKSSPFDLYNYSSEIKVEDPCTMSCKRFNTEKPKCGNGVKDKGENCVNCIADLRHECQNCGNSKKDFGEECDNGVLNGYDGKCTFDCMEEKNGRYCGDGIVQEELGEVCDLGDLNGQFLEKNSVYYKKDFLKKFNDGLDGIGDWLDNNVDVKGGQNYSVDFFANYMGVIDLEMDSNIGFDGDTKTENSIFVGDVDVLGGDFDVNKIKGGIQQGIRKMLIDNWLDPQIRYIANQLTKMHVNVKLPNVGQLVDEINNIDDLTKQFSNIWESDVSFDNRVDTGFASNLGAWSYINYDNLSSLNKTIANPFESLASIFDESNLINISVEPITVKIPWIFAEDINSYELYLRQWLEVNEGILNQWKENLEAFVVKCDKIVDDREKQLCYNNAKRNLDEFVNFEGGDWIHLQNQIYANLKILQEYRNFPFEVYEWIHVIDRYMSEIISLISSTIGYLSYWTTINSQRFVGYVDAIILAINIIKTYQIIIDFSKEWSNNCGSCSRDTYDQYSCKLSILCNGINLPIIQIPNFKLPNITLDLSNIDLGLDIILPSFHFQPIKIALPELPNLPEPPTVGVNIRLFDLPNIPLLPEPPELPELPSFIPEIDMELPILPPAPELPAIPNEINTIFDFTKMVGKIYCIVKGKFGLVGESSVKAKIEQLTQRTYEVSWIDNIKDFTNWTPVPVKNYGLDYEISSYVDFQFDFSTFYNSLDLLAKSINNYTTSLTKDINKATNKIVDEDLLNKIDSIDSARLEFDLDLSMADDLPFKDFVVDGYLSDEVEYTGYENAKSMLKNVLTHFKTSASETPFADSLNSSIKKIENQIDRENLVEPNIQGLEVLEKDLLAYLNSEKSKFEGLANMINNDYDGFLAMIGSQDDDPKSDSGELLTFNVQLFNVNSSTKDNINLIKNENPYTDLLDNKKEIIDGYWNAINSNTANDLGLSNSQYLTMRESIGKMKKQISSLYSLAKPISSTDLIAKNGASISKTLLSVSDNHLRLGSNMDVAEVIDPSSLSDGIYDKVVRGADSGKLAKIVYSDFFASRIGSNYYQVPRDGYHDIILYDDKSVYVKCKDQNCFRVGGSSEYYRANLVNEVPYEEKYIKIRNKQLKIADVNDEVKNWKVEGQSYDNLSFSWKMEGVSGYLLEFAERIDYNYEKNFIVKPIYVLALPSGGPSVDDLFANGIKLELIGDKKGKFEKIKNLYGTGKDLVQVVYYDASKDRVNIKVSNVDRKWYYARISTLDFVKDAYEISSPWSNQIVAGKQMLGDEVGPEGEAVLYRTSTSENVSQGNDLGGYVGTRYNLIVNWSDDVALSYINLSKDGKLLDERYTSEVNDSVSTRIDIHTKGGEREVYNSLGIDQFGNKTQKVITVSYSVPEISITDISKNSDGKTALIRAELSQDIDQGNVSFQRKRGSAWKTMKSSNGKNSDIILNRGQKFIEGMYSAGNEIAIYDKNEKVIALMNPDTAEIKFQPGYDKMYDVRVVVEDSLVLQIYDKKTLSSIFSIYLPIDDCSKIDAGNFKVRDLKNNLGMGMFNGGKVIYREGSNVLFISPTCHLYSEGGLEGEYAYDVGSNYLVLTLYQKSDWKQNNPIKLWFRARPLEIN